MRDLWEGGKGGEKFTLWSPFWSLAWLLVALLARAVCQYLRTVTHPVGSLNPEGKLMLLWAARTTPSFVCSFYLDSVRTKWHLCWLFPGLLCCEHRCSGGGGGGDGGSSFAAHRALLRSSFPPPCTALHLSLANKANTSALPVSQEVCMYAKSLPLLKRIGEASSEVKQGRSFRGTQQCLSAVVRNVTTELRFVQVVSQRVMTSSEIRQGSAGRLLLCLGNNERRALKSLARLWPCYLAMVGSVCCMADLANNEVDSVQDRGAARKL